MKIAVKDAGLLIDMDLMGVLDVWVCLGIETLTTDQVFQEVRGRHPNVVAHVERGSIVVIPIGLERIFQEIEEERYRKLSPEDVSVLILARETGAMLLTCDGSLREEAEGQCIEVHGSIWVMDRLVDEERLAGSVAADKLEALMNRAGSEKRFLPKKEAKRFIRKWRGIH